jgi:ADP-ribose pyrophosphatase YjhB (NUDIX family)
MQRTPDIALGAIVKNYKLFLILRAKNPCLGKWNAPGGKREADEDLKDTCKREIMEETRLKVDVVKKLYYTERGSDIIYPIHVYLCNLVGRYNPVIDYREISDCGFFSYSELMNKPLVDHIEDTLLPILLKENMIK